MVARSLDPWAFWLTRRRTRRAKTLSEFARGISLYAHASVEGRAVRVARLYRKALRTLEPGVETEGVHQVAALRNQVEERLRRASVVAWASRYRGTIVRRVAPPLAVIAIVALVIPTFRHRLFPPNLAAGKVWAASSALTGFPAYGVIANDADAAVLLFHTAQEPSPSMVIDLGAVTPIGKVRVTNRQDCCGDRAVPLTVEVGIDRVSFTRVAYRRSDFRSWSASFPTTAARYVRLRVDRPSMLHLQSIAVF